MRRDAKETDLAEVKNDANETDFAAERIFLLYKILQCEKQIVSTCFGSLQQLSTKLDLHCVSCFTYMLERWCGPVKTNSADTKECEFLVIDVSSPPPKKNPAN